MISKSIIFRIFLLNLFSINLLTAESVPTFGLGFLVYYSPVIITATPLDEPGQMWTVPDDGSDHIRRFLVRHIIRGDSMQVPDTISINVSNYYFERSDFKDFILFGEMYQVSDEDTTLIFGTCLSGIRPFIGDKTFIPFQHDSPGRYHFHEHAGESLEDWVFHIHKTIARFDALLALRHIFPPAKQNEALFAWIEQQSPCWTPEAKAGYSSFSDCDWGPYEWEAFRWINGNGIWRDYWKSILLSDRLLAKYGVILNRPEGSPDAFNSPEARAFLMEQISADNHAPYAMHLLSNTFQEDAYETEHKISLAEKQQIITLLLPYFEKEETRFSVFYLLRTALLGSHGHWKEEYGLLPMEVLKKAMESSSDKYFISTVKTLIQELEKN